MEIEIPPSFCIISLSSSSWSVKWWCFYWFAMTRCKWNVDMDTWCQHTCPSKGHFNFVAFPHILVLLLVLLTHWELGRRTLWEEGNGQILRDIPTVEHYRKNEQCFRVAVFSPERNYISERRTLYWHWLFANKEAILKLQRNVSGYWGY